jgi:FtsH-binding integral membrane protein
MFDKEMFLLILSAIMLLCSFACLIVTFTDKERKRLSIVGIVAFLLTFALILAISTTSVFTHYNSWTYVLWINSYIVTFFSIALMKMLTKKESRNIILSE